MVNNMTINYNISRVAQWKRAGPITQRSVDRNYALLEKKLLKIITFSTFLIKQELNSSETSCDRIEW
jgi:hypothetical protein